MLRPWKLAASHFSRLSLLSLSLSLSLAALTHSSAGEKASPLAKKAVAASTQVPPATLSYACILSKSPTSLEAAQEFTEDETVYAHLTFSRLKQGAHRVEGEWIRPDRIVQDRARHAFTVKEDKQPTTVYLWLKFHSPVLARNPLGAFFGVMEKERWAVHIQLDGKELTRKVFDVWR